MGDDGIIKKSGLKPDFFIGCLVFISVVQSSYISSMKSKTATIFVS